MKKIVVGIRIDEHLKDKLQKLADNAGVSLSAYASEKLEDAISETERIDLLVRNMYEEVLKLGDMLSIMQGFNVEALATLFSRVSLALTPLQKKDSKENRGKALEALQGYLRKTNERLNEGANVWIGETSIMKQQEKE